MSMALPNFLIIEMRLAFRNCARQYRTPISRPFSNTIISRNDVPRKDSPNDPDNRALTARKAAHAVGSNTEDRRRGQDQTGLATQDPEKRAVGTGRRVPVPLKVIPKAQLGPQVHLTPRQRLHVEMLTRRPTVNVAEKPKIYRERIQIYHLGSRKENFLAILKVSSIVSICAVTFVIAPAHLNAGTTLLTTALIWLGGFIPALVTHYSTKSWVNRIFLDLPPHARGSPKAVMEYAKNLPSETMLDIRYLKLWGLEGSIQGKTSDFLPTRGEWLRPLSFRWKDNATLQLRKSSRWDPTAFYVEKTSAVGEKSKNTVPGIWETVYRQIMDDPSRPSQKWKSNLEPWES